MANLISESRLERTLLNIAEEQSAGGGLNVFDLRIFQFVSQIHYKHKVTGGAIEIGVWKGQTSVALMSMLEASEPLFLIDKYLRNEALEAIDKFATNHGLSSPIIYEKADSIKVDFQQFCGKNEIRIALIDGEHSYEAVYSDLSNLQSVVV